ncbi:MAG: hypothetical protein ACRDX8_13790 [Acidimicrobiales bacterium]
MHHLRCDLGQRGVTSGELCLLDGYTINGTVTVLPGGILEVVFTTITGSVSVNGSTGFSGIVLSHVGGSVLVQNSGPGSLFILGSDDFEGGGGNNIKGSVNFSNNQGAIEITDNVIHGSTTITGNTGGGIEADGLFGVEGNTIKGDLVCINNSPGPVNDEGAGDPNSVKGLTVGQCVGIDSFVPPESS